MPSYLHPGVYIEEIPSGSKPIEGVSTSTAAFIGPANRGPNGEATLIQNLDDYKKVYGNIASETDTMGLAVQAFYLNGGKSAYICRITGSTASAASISVAGEGTSNANVLTISASSVGEWGEEVYIRLEKPEPTALSFKLEVGHIKSGDFIADEVFNNLTMNNKDNNYAITVVNRNSSLVRLSPEEAATSGLQAGKLIGAAIDLSTESFQERIKDNMTMRININGLGAKTINLGAIADLLTGDNSEDGREVADAIKDAVVKIDISELAYKNFTCSYDDSHQQFTLISGTSSSSSSIRVYTGDGSPTDLAALLKLNPDSNPTSVHGSANIIPVETLGVGDNGVPLNDGADGPPPSQSDYETFLGTKLKKVRDVSILVLPGVSHPTNSAIVETTLSHCESMRDRVLIIDPPQETELADAETVEGLGLSPSTYSVMYYPWIQISNPFYYEETDPKTLTIAPSAFAAGMWAKIDGKRGVWKAPAGVETQLLGAAGLEFIIEDGEQDFLNPLGINAIRRLPSFGSVIWGSRTLATKADPEWRYVPVRRTAIFIEQSIYNGIQWAVFEPNDHPLWGALRANIGSFMNGLFRAGAFQGKTANDAYFVRCGLGDTMTQGDIDRGQVIVIVGFAPLKPAEFVIVKIQQKVAQQ